MTAVRLSSRSNSPPLSLAPFSFRPTHLAAMAVTGLDTTTVAASSSKKDALSSNLNIGRPLPRPPATEGRQPLQLPSQLRQHVLSGQTNRLSTNLTEVSKTSTRPRPTSSYRQASNYFRGGSSSSALLTALNEPNVLHAIIRSLDWPDAYTLFTTCKKLSETFRIIPLRDAVLARFVPGYAQCLRDRDMQYYQDISITVHDLDRLLISQRVGLHRYPIHSLKINQALYPTVEDEQLREKLAALAQAHSKFVLLLQSLVHSSSTSIPQETEEGSSRPRFSPIQTMRELTFPAPLLYSEQPPARTNSTAAAARLTKHARHKSAPTNPFPIASPTRAAWSFDGPRTPRPSADITSTMISVGSVKKGRKLSIFGRKSLRRATPPPPPPDEPRALKMYSSTWRKSCYAPTGNDINIDLSLGFGGSLKRFRASTHRRIGSLHNDSSDSSTISMTRSRNSTSNMNATISEMKATSPHDLILATSRVRAPILRVFVPCTKLETDSEALVKCEQQLVESGLWDHLSTGDLVCNLGYVPPVEDSNGSSEGDDLSARGQFIMRPTRQSGQANSNAGSNTSQIWLIFDGHVLVPYTPPNLLPLNEPLNLPTPFYYAHIMPSFTNLSYIITRLPVCDDVPQLTLVNSSKKVPSPHSPTGHAIVKKYSWIARVVRVKTEMDREIGEGWFGEWVLEGEGTCEGKQLLINALRGYELGHREWELVREKSGGGKLWLRLLTT